MQTKIALELYRELTANLTERHFLKLLNLSRSAMQRLIQDGRCKEKLAGLVHKKNFSGADGLSVAEGMLNLLDEKPAQDWLAAAYQYTLGLLFPGQQSMRLSRRQEQAVLVLLATFRTLLEHERQNHPFQPTLQFQFLSQEEMEQAGAGLEYARLLKLFDQQYIYEFMRIGSELTPYNTLSHIAGVHFVSMHVARQLARAGVPVDLALVSGSAVGHDIGKYGCRDNEANRVPYLHYYYTELWFDQNEMPATGHIAFNHSTWDLELENMSVESLILIYSDFRVKNRRTEEGKEVVEFYSLADSFHVILSKLDNVDDAKRERYLRVYAKLRDFEDYMLRKGVSTDLSSEQMEAPVLADPVLLDPAGVLDRLKHLAIEHNISLMNKFTSDAAFGNILEAARSESKWKNIRAYLNIFQEYSTYMTQKQKMLTMSFLYELLMHREGDIRRQSAVLMGSILSHFDEEYRKELPEGVKPPQDEITSLDLWKKYLAAILYPDHKVTDQHRRWIGYALKIITGSLVANSKGKERDRYLTALFDYFLDLSRDDLTAFILLDTLVLVPLEHCDKEDLHQLLRFTASMAQRAEQELHLVSLRFLQALSLQAVLDQEDQELCLSILSSIEEEGVVSISYLKNRIKSTLGFSLQGEDQYHRRLREDPRIISNLFLENLKQATPWVRKVVNIELLLEQLDHNQRDQLLHVATHFSNLLKVSERVAVRHAAGEALVSLGPLLLQDQINEITIELTKGLEIGEYEFSKYIPEYLGGLALFLHPTELDEFLVSIGKLQESTNDRVGSVVLATLGIMVTKYPAYQERFGEAPSVFVHRRELMLGMILKGLANYEEAVSHEAFLVIGQILFGSTTLDLDQKHQVFRYLHKKMLAMLSGRKETQLSFYNSAASLNHIYRFISDYVFYRGGFELEAPEKIAFFPGTFDPFTLSHKGIVKEIKKLGFEVYLALDEFSWSKKTQPRLIRRKIIDMSVADEGEVYLFPDEIPVNIANTRDLANLEALFPASDVYIVVGSDVIYNASSYKAPKTKGSIHHFNHVIFKRSSISDCFCSEEEMDHAIGKLDGKVMELMLPIHLEDISSTRIRENIDQNRDISNLIDPIAQNYIYDNSLYLRENQYKHVLSTTSMRFEWVQQFDRTLLDELFATILAEQAGNHPVRQYLKQKSTRGVLVRDGAAQDRIVAISTFHPIGTADLYKEFQNMELAARIRTNTSGRIIVLSGIAVASEAQIPNLEQLALTETLAQCLKEDFTYAIYRNRIASTERRVINVLRRQGFSQVKEAAPDERVYAVDLWFPVTLYHNIVTTIKEPFNRNPRVLAMVEQIHERLQYTLTRLYPGTLILSFDSNVMHQRLVERITKTNNVSSVALPVRTLGDYMCVPFGQILMGVAVPNTVTKALHTEKTFDLEIKKFHLKEFPYYSPLQHQVRTLKSFRRPILLVDDLLHKGHRLRDLDHYFSEEGVNISKVIVGILTGSGKDRMDIQKREVDGVYFIPNLQAWFDEANQYPFVGGDGVHRELHRNAGLIPSINMILPYVAANFLHNTTGEALYEFSKTCLENSRDLLRVLEEEYQKQFERNLTLARLGEVVVSPRCPDQGESMRYDMTLPASVYVTNDIERLVRLRGLI